MQKALICFGLGALLAACASKPPEKACLNGRAAASGSPPAAADTGAPPVCPGDGPRGLCKQAIQWVVDQHRAELIGCYTSATQANPDLRERTVTIVAGFTIQPTGRISRASIKKTDSADPSLNNCVLRRLEAWLFPEPPNPAVTKVKAYPFRFSNNDLER